MTARRTHRYFNTVIEPLLRIGYNILVSAHANSLRSLIMKIEDINEEDVPNLKIRTALPTVYHYVDGDFQKLAVPQVSFVL